MKATKIVFAILISLGLAWLGYKRILFVFVYTPDTKTLGIIEGYGGNTSDYIYKVSFYNHKLGERYIFETELPHPKLKYAIGDTVVVYFNNTNPNVAYIEGEGFFQYLFLGIIIFIIARSWYEVIKVFSHSKR